MWQDLSLIHGKPDTQFTACGMASGTAANSASGMSPAMSAMTAGMIWTTCLRQIHFVLPGALYGMPVSQGELYRGSQAHRFLVEVCSGLHSPLLGETEIFGQFRAFRESQVWHSAWVPLLHAVEEDVKKLRRTHLMGLGAQSYGSLTRKRLPDGAPVVVVGAGRLADDLLPWLKKHPVMQLARNPAKTLGALPLNAETPEGAHWIIAAPISNDALETLWLNKKVGTVLDFRGEASFVNAPAAAYYDLKALFAELEVIKNLLAARRTIAMEAAAELSHARGSMVFHRPYGWEDAFA